MKNSLFLFLAATLTALCLSSQAANYAGNGATGFGGSVGLGSVSITDTPTGMTLTMNRGAGTMDNALVLYLDTKPGGFNDTSLFSDTGPGDPGRTAISGFNQSNPSRTVASFPSGFGADYAVSIENGFIGVFGLVAGGNGSLNFLFGQGQSGINTDPSYSISMTAAQMSQIGLNAGSGQIFFFVGSLISGSAYRSNETIGPSVTVPADGGGNAGFNNPQTFTGDLSYQLTQAPEPSTAAFFGFAGLIGSFYARRRK